MVPIRPPIYTSEPASDEVFCKRTPVTVQLLRVVAPPAEPTMPPIYPENPNTVTPEVDVVYPDLRDLVTLTPTRPPIYPQNPETATPTIPPAAQPAPGVPAQPSSPDMAPIFPTTPPTGQPETSDIPDTPEIPAIPETPNTPGISIISDVPVADDSNNQVSNNISNTNQTTITPNTSVDYLIAQGETQNTETIYAPETPEAEYSEGNIEETTPIAASNFQWGILVGAIFLIVGVTTIGIVVHHKKVRK
jgi:hypothetical protein